MNSFFGPEHVVVFSVLLSFNTHGLDARTLSFAPLSVELLGLPDSQSSRRGYQSFRAHASIFPSRGE